MRLPDYGEEYTEKQIRALERRINSVYKEAEADINRKMKDHIRKYKVKERIHAQEVKDGKISRSDFEAWKRGQAFTGRQWQAKKDSICKTLYNANSTAQKILNGETNRVFCANANFMAYSIEKKAGINFGFGLYDNATVARLLRDEPNLLPKPKVDKPKDVAWNQKKITRQITQGIIQGESLDEIADRLSEVTGSSNHQAMIMHARTAMTGAQNAGRLYRMEQAGKMGIVVEKEWMATLDAHTRPTHRQLDGQTVPVNEPFVVGRYEIMYPADPDAAPAMTYNCRCTMVTNFPEYPDEYERYDNIEGKPIANMTYREWEQAKQSPNAIIPNIVPAVATPVIKHRSMTEYGGKLQSTMQQSDFDSFRKLVDENEEEGIQNVYDLYLEQVTKFEYNEKEYSRFRPSLRDVRYAYDKHPEISKYGTLAHENGHAFDEFMKNDKLTFGEIDLINSKCPIGSGRLTTLKRSASTSDQFLFAMRKDKENLRKVFESPEEMRKMKSGVLRNQTAGVQDAMDGFFSTQNNTGDKFLPWGHGNSYYNRIYNKRIKGFNNEKNLKDALIELGFDASNQTKVKRILRDYDTASELWANTCSAVTVGGDELKVMREYMPNTVDAFIDIIRGAK